MNPSCRCERGLTVSVLTAAQLRARRWAALEAAPHQSGKRSTGKAISDRRVPFDVDVVDSMITTYRTEGRPSWLQPKKDNRSAAQAPDNKSRSLIWTRICSFTCRDAFRPTASRFYSACLTATFYALQWWCSKANTGLCTVFLLENDYHCSVDKRVD